MPGTDGCVHADLTILYADLNQDGLVDIDDIVCQLIEAGGGTPCANPCDIQPCGGNSLCDIDDIVGVLLTAGDLNNPPCPHPCPAHP